MTVDLHLLHPDDQLHDCQDKGQNHRQVGQIGVVEIDILVELARQLQIHGNLKVAD